jgi:hypothetical protein
MNYPIIDIKTIEGPLSLSVQFGGLVIPGRNLVLVCWEHVTIGCRVDDQFVAVWANCLGALITAFVTAASTATTTAAATTAAAATAIVTAAATTTISFGHGR